MTKFNKVSVLCSALLAILLVTTNASTVQAGGSEGPGLIKRLLTSEEVRAERTAIAMEYALENEVFLAELENVVVKYSAMAVGVPPDFSDVYLGIKSQLERDKKAIKSGKDLQYWRESLLGAVELILPDTVGMLGVAKMTTAFSTAFVYGYFWGI
ncbi:hypothetical protein [Maritalea mediterranea]|uniref:Uncharacterized protein n=1 Tax=Maritalea mediterranea TaxID=2909667 RepID=A0ABS9E6Y5_9HYPH|nr:hypothetical protein [Maritalea mediterranea]MCF4098616.1 hypothetical protein [Maritalea mediterranea]